MQGKAVNKFFVLTVASATAVIVWFFGWFLYTKLGLYAEYANTDFQNLLLAVTAVPICLGGLAAHKIKAKINTLTKEEMKELFSKTIEDLMQDTEQQTRINTRNIEDLTKRLTDIQTSLRAAPKDFTTPAVKELSKQVTTLIKNMEKSEHPEDLSTGASVLDYEHFQLIEAITKQSLGVTAKKSGKTVEALQMHVKVHNERIKQRGVCMSCLKANQESEQAKTEVTINGS